MRIQEILATIKEAVDAKGPAKISTGGTGSIGNPAHMPSAYYEGDPEKFDYKAQKKNYEKLKAALASVGKKFNYVAVARSPKGPDTFVATAPGVVWYKYVPNNPMGAQNWIYIDGVKMQLSTFLFKTPAEQQQLLKSTATDATLHQDPIKYVKELLKAKVSGSELTHAVESQKEGIQRRLARQIVDVIDKPKNVETVQRFIATLNKKGVNLDWLKLDSLIAYSMKYILHKICYNNNITKIIEVMNDYIHHGIKVSRADVIKTLDADKQELLKRIKNLGIDPIIQTINVFKQLGVNWPELKLSYFIDQERFANSLINGYIFDGEELQTIVERCKEEGIDFTPVVKTVFDEHADKIAAKLMAYIRLRMYADKARSLIEYAASIGADMSKVGKEINDNKNRILNDVFSKAPLDANAIDTMKRILDAVGLDWPELSSENLATTLNDNQKLIIVGILQELKQGYAGLALKSVESLRRLGMNWPELDVIERSSRADLKSKN